MTIRHPAKVKKYNKKILASGVDTLVLSLNVFWEEPLLFTYLDEIKEKAKECSAEYPGELKHPSSPHPWPFSIRPHGSKGGYAWLFEGSDFSYKIGNWMEPGPRPSVIIGIRSETLWHLGTEEAIRIATGIIKVNGGSIVDAKLSRVDLCVDVLMPEKRWSINLRKYRVTRASDFVPYYRYDILTGMQIGKGVIFARLYDKALEIAQISKKIWMFDIWGIPEVPKGQKIIRVEFQIRREVLKELGLNTPKDLIEKAVNAWAYCTNDWLKFRDRPGLHHTQRSTFTWWKEIQGGFNDIQNAKPLVREKAMNVDKQRLIQQANGLIISLHALRQEEGKVDYNKPSCMQDCVVSYVEELTRNPQKVPNVQARLKQKRSKYHREKISQEERVHKMARFFSN